MSLFPKRDETVALKEGHSADEKAPQDPIAEVSRSCSRVANKLARIAWAVLSTGQDYRAIPDAPAA